MNKKYGLRFLILNELHKPDTKAVTFVSKARDYYHTMRHLTPFQLLYQVRYRLKQTSSLKKSHYTEGSLHFLKMLPLPSIKKIIEKDGSEISVTLLNKTSIYSHQVNWDDLSHGRLWNYHLQYADFLKQEDLPAGFREDLILDLYRCLTEGKLRPEPYPASLRIMNSIRFISVNSEKLKNRNELVDYVFSDLNYLRHNLEYHLMGNHLIENAFALLMGGYFFKNSEWKNLGTALFEEQVPEQILEDGAHFERSTMYHQILLFRFIDAITYLPPDSELSIYFIQTVQKMLSWTRKMSFRNGDLARFNDATDDQAPTKSEIFELSDKCRIQNIPKTELSESGFRKYDTSSFELKIDSNGVGPSYQPGHAHASSLSFILYFEGQPVITDPGVSTYEPGDRRNWERSTQAHNTVTFNRLNTADVWDQFRVGRRPDVSILKETESEIALQLKQTLKSGENFEHFRSFSIQSNIIEIEDRVNLKKPVEGRLYFDPSVSFQTLSHQEIELSNGLVILFLDVQHLHTFTYDYSKGFNLLEKSYGIEYSFKGNALLKIMSPTK